jgi:hypothetical protein
MEIDTADAAGLLFNFGFIFGFSEFLRMPGHLPELDKCIYQTD